MAQESAKKQDVAGFSKNVLIDGPPTRHVKLNVGGYFFHTSLGTLRKYDCMLRTMFSGRIPVCQDNEGYVIIDRSGKHFEKILNFLRDGTISLPECHLEVSEILYEGKYYLLQELVLHCTNWLQLINRARNAPVEFPNVPIVYSEEQVEQIVKSCPDRPVIEFLMNRKNYNFSYTQHSDENFLKNQEIFEKLVLRINKRVIFVKNMGMGSSEMCRWRFHLNGGLKKTDISCTSIVYTTDRKQTKVDFPEARIYEETMNVVLSIVEPLDERPMRSTSYLRCLYSPGAIQNEPASSADDLPEFSMFGLDSINTASHSSGTITPFSPSGSIGKNRLCDCAQPSISNESNNRGNSSSSMLVTQKSESYALEPNSNNNSP